MNLIVVFGATGSQGGSVVKQLVQDARWKVRAVTRNPQSDKARQLQHQGVEVVGGDVNDRSSLARALEGVTGIFFVTAFYESIFNKGLDGAGEEEVEQFKNLALAASELPTLQHLVVSTLPPADKVSGGKLKVPHFDYKQKGVDWIKENTPKLWAKTTEFWPSWYTSNLSSQLPLMKMYSPPMSGAFLFLQPSKGSAILPIAGELETNCGIIVEAVFKAGPRSLGKIAICVTEYLPIGDVPVAYEELTGRTATYVEVSDEAYTKMWGLVGTEIASQLRWSEEHPDWHAIGADRLITMSELGIEGKLVGFRQALFNMKDKLVEN